MVYIQLIYIYVVVMMAWIWIYGQAPSTRRRKSLITQSISRYSDNVGRIDGLSLRSGGRIGGQDGFS